MKVPKPVLIGLLFSAALFVGYQVSEALHDDSALTAAATTAPAARSSALKPESKEPVVINLTLAGTGNYPQPGTVVNVTLDDQKLSTTTASAEGRRVDAAPPGDVEFAVGNSDSAAAAAERDWSGIAPPSARDRSSSVAGGVVYTLPVGEAAPTIVDNVTTIEIPTVRSNLTVDAGDRGNTTQDFSITAIGNNIVIAYGDSIAFAGDHGALTANTGDASSSGTVALDVSGSNVATGVSVSALTPRGAGVVDSSTPPSTTTDGLDPNHSVPGRGLAISGYEDHSLNVVGRDHVVTYDDSNVFIARNGQINANTGDTDSAGLNVVDATGSVVRSGDHYEDSVEDSDSDTDTDTETDGDADADSDESESLVGVNSATPAGAPTDDDADSEELLDSPGASAGPLVEAALPRASALVSDDEESAGAGTTASGDEAVVIGGDGYDNLAVDVTGEGHVVSYDDSNVIIGGEGDVNAQIGDSDTAGAVVMGVNNSVIEAGDSS